MAAELGSEVYDDDWKIALELQKEWEKEEQALLAERERRDAELARQLASSSSSSHGSQSDGSQPQAAEGPPLVRRTTMTERLDLLRREASQNSRDGDGAPPRSGVKRSRSEFEGPTASSSHDDEALARKLQEEFDAEHMATTDPRDIDVALLMSFAAEEEDEDAAPPPSSFSHPRLARRAVDFGEATSHLGGGGGGGEGGDADVDVRGGAAVDPTSLFLLENVRIDTGMYHGAQSWRGQHSKRAALSAQGPYCERVFNQMLLREAAYCGKGEWVVFYHSYSLCALLYEVNACFARCIYELPDHFAPLPRLLKKPFDQLPCLDMLLQQFSRMSGQDHNPTYRALAISCSATLFNTSEAPPITCFKQGYSCSDMSFINALGNILLSCAVPSEEVRSLVDRIVDLAKRYQITTSAFGGGACVDPGHMLQIFVKTSVVDDVAYAAQPMGVLDSGRMPLSSYLTTGSPIDGQARLFMHPTLFMDQESTKVFHYAGNEFFARNRVHFQKELQILLGSVLESNAGIARAFQGIEGNRAVEAPSLDPAPQFPYMSMPPHSRVYRRPKRSRR